MKRLPLSGRIEQALLTGEGGLAQTMVLAASYQQGDWERAASSVASRGCA